MQLDRGNVRANSRFLSEWSHIAMNICSRYANEEGRAAIHQSILSGSVMACEFLILNSVRIDAVDGQGNSALHMAAKQGNTGQVYARIGLRSLAHESY